MSKTDNAEALVAKLYAHGIREFFNEAPAEATEVFGELITLAKSSEDVGAAKLQVAMNEFRHVRQATENTPTILSVEIHDNHNTELSRQLHAAMGLADEAGEVLAIFKKRLFGYKKQAAEALVKELGDVFWYFDLMLEAAGIDFADLLLQNAAKLRERHADRIAKQRTDNALDVLYPVVEHGAIAAPANE